MFTLVHISFSYIELLVKAACLLFFINMNEVLFEIIIYTTIDWFVYILRRRLYMIKFSKILACSIFMTLACSSFALADGNAFTPLNFDNASYSNSNSVRTSSSTTSASKPQQATTNQQVEVTGSSNMQSAILKLDNAQVDVRNELLNLKAKYSDIDSQYKLIKNERAILDKQIKTTEKRIKQIEKAKEKIRKNMI